MHTPPRLRIEPRPSRVGLAMIALACFAAAGLVAALPLASPVALACLVAIGLAFRCGCRRCAGRDVPAIAHVGIDRTITVTDRQGRSRDGIVLADSCVTALLTTIVWRANGMPWWRPSEAILVLPDTLPRDDFRRLRTTLRYSFPVACDATSGVDAG